MLSKLAIRAVPRMIARIQRQIQRHNMVTPEDGYFIYLFDSRNKRHGVIPKGYVAESNAKQKEIVILSTALRSRAVRKSSGVGDLPYKKEKKKEKSTSKERLEPLAGG
jgi:hypothetical protein